MKFNKFVFDNYKKYKDRIEILASDGINIISAKNGKGKSSILDAIGLILFGINSTNKLDDLINYDSDKKTFYIEIDFDYEGNNYVSSLDYEKGRTQSSKRMIYKDGEMVCEGADACKTYFSELFDTSLLYNALFSRQGENNIVKCTDSERSNILKKIKNVDFSDVITNEIEPEIENLSNELKDVEIQVGVLDAKEYRQCDEYPILFSEDEILLKEKEKVVIEKEIMVAQEKNNQIEKLKEDVDKKLHAISVLEGDIDSIDLQLQKYKKELGEAQERIIEDKSIYFISQKENMVDPTTLIKVSQDKNKESIDTIKSDVSSLEEQIDKIKVERIAVFDDSKLTEVNEKLIEARATLKDVEKKLESDICPTCNRPYEEAYSHNKDRELKEILEKSIIDFVNIKTEELVKKKEKDEEIANNMLNKDKRVQLKSLLDLKKQTLESLVSSNEQEEQRIKENWDRERKDFDEKIKLAKDSYLNEIGTRDNRIQEVKEWIDSSFERHSGLIIKIEEEKTELKGLQEELSKKESISIYDLDEKQVGLKKEIDSYYETLSRNTEIKKQNEKTKEEKQADEKEKSKLKKKFDEINNGILSYKTSKELLNKEIPAYIISQSIQEIEDGINTFVDNVYDRSLGIEFKLNKSSIAMNYGKKTKVPVKSLSGAEQKLVQIGFIAKFNNDLGLSCIFLDEPNENMDSSNTEELFILLGEMCTEFNQAFIITHNELMRDYLTTNYSPYIIEL